MSNRSRNVGKGAYCLIYTSYPRYMILRERLPMAARRWQR